MQWNTSYVESVFSFANNINTHEGGSHLSGFKAALTRTLNDYAPQERHPQGEGRQPRGRGRPRGARGRDLRQAPRPAVRGADEDEARQPLGAGLVEQTVNHKLAEFLEENATDAKQILQKAIAARREAGRPEGARADAAKERARERVAAGQARRLPDQRPESAELYLVEGKSAGGTAKTRATSSTRRSCRFAAR